MTTQMSRGKYKSKKTHHQIFAKVQTKDTIETEVYHTQLDTTFKSEFRRGVRIEDKNV